jgi:hypothetical protein
MARAFLLIGAFIFVALGTYHGVLTLRDLWAPSTFTPTDDSVRKAMQESRLALNQSVNLWDAWMGFNLSHSLALILFGGGLIIVGCQYFPAFARSSSLQLMAIVVAAAYVVLSLRFWFWGPAVGTGIGLFCFLSTFLMLRSA